MAVSWTITSDDFQLLVSLPKGVGPESCCPAPCKIWERKPATQSWPDAIEIDGSTKIAVPPGKVDQVR